MHRDRVTKNPRMGGQVLRYHTWPVLRQQSNAEHTWQVMRIYYQIFGAPEPKVTARLLFHDIGEIGAGDPPFPSKRDHPDLKTAHDRIEREAALRMGVKPEVFDEDLGATERLRIKICDLFEMWEFGLTELRMGNLFAMPIANDTYLGAMELKNQLSNADRAKITSYVLRTQNLFEPQTILTTGRV